MWQAVTFTWPETLALVADGNSSKLAGVDDELTAAAGRIQAAPAPSFVNNPVSGVAAGAMADFNSLIDSVFNNARVVCAHPWVQGIGQGVDHYRHLSPANAVLNAALKMQDEADAHRPTANTVDAVALLITGDGFSSFGNALSAFNTVFPIAELQMCERRCLQLAGLEKQKHVLPDAPINARWKPRGLMNFRAVSTPAAAVGEQSTHAMAYEIGGESPIDEVLNLTHKKASALAATDAALSEVQSVFSGGAGKGLFFSNKTPGVIKTELESSGADHGAPLAACVVITAAPGELIVLQEMLGL